MYDVVVVGLTVIELPVCPPDQANVPPVVEGVAVNVAEPPAQMVWLVEVTVGVGFTVTDIVVGTAH